MMRRFHVQFTDKNLTGNAGLIHLGRFIDKLGLGQALEDGLSIERGANAKYGVADAFLSRGAPCPLPGYFIYRNRSHIPHFHG